MSKPRFELVVRVVSDNPEKLEEPKYRDVLHEIAVPLIIQWNTEPSSLPPERILATTAVDLLAGLAEPIVEQIRKAPVDMMVVQCIQGLQQKMAGKAGSWVGVRQVTPEKKD